MMVSIVPSQRTSAVVTNSGCASLVILVPTVYRACSFNLLYSTIQ